MHTLYMQEQTTHATVPLQPSKDLLELYTHMTQFKYFSFLLQIILGHSFVHQIVGIVVVS